MKRKVHKMSLEGWPRKIACVPGQSDFVGTVKWKDVTCKNCLKKRRKK